MNHLISFRTTISWVKRWKLNLLLKNVPLVKTSVHGWQAWICNNNIDFVKLSPSSSASWGKLATISARQPPTKPNKLLNALLDLETCLMTDKEVDHLLESLSHNYKKMSQPYLVTQTFYFLVPIWAIRSQSWSRNWDLLFSASVSVSKAETSFQKSWSQSPNLNLSF